MLCGTCIPFFFKWYHLHSIIIMMIAFTTQTTWWWWSKTVHIFDDHYLLPPAISIFSISIFNFQIEAFHDWYIYKILICLFCILSVCFDSIRPSNHQIIEASTKDNIKVILCFVHFACFCVCIILVIGDEIMVWIRIARFFLGCFLVCVIFSYQSTSFFSLW